MKLLSIREWGHLTVGPDPGHDCTRAEADRLIAVARASALGGTEGARILTDQYRRLRAGQVVGVLAAEGAQLEILPKIDFSEETDEGETRRIRDQLIHMLSIAHDPKVIEKTLKVYEEVFSILSDAVQGGDLSSRLEGPPAQPVFRRV